MSEPIASTSFPTQQQTQLNTNFTKQKYYLNNIHKKKQAKKNLINKNKFTHIYHAIYTCKNKN